MKKTLARILTSVIPEKRVRHLARTFLMKGVASLLRQNGSVRLYYYTGKKLGDMLNRNRMQYFEILFRYTPAYFADLSSIGSFPQHLR